MAGRVFAQADIHHAVTAKEVAHIRAFLPRARVIVIPHVLQDFPASAPTGDEVTPCRKIVFLGRIARVKGIDQLIGGFALAGLAGSWELVIAGPPQEREHYEALRKLAAEHGIASSVSFIGPVAGEEKWSLLREAWAVCVPSHTEALGMVNLEAALCATPTVTTPNSGLADWHRHGGLLCEPTCEAISAALRDVASWRADERANRGTRLRNYVAAEFTTDAERSKWAETYRAIANAKPHQLGKGGAGGPLRP